MEKDLELKLDKNRLKLRIHEDHSSSWITMQELAKILELDENIILQFSKEYELDITSDVTSIKSRINKKVAEDFIEYIIEKKK